MNYTAKRAATKRKHDNGVDEKNQASPPKPKAAAKEKINKFTNDFEQINFSLDKDYNFKISSWNVAGLRALALKGGLDYVNYEKPDVFCVQVRH